MRRRLLALMGLFLPGAAFAAPPAAHAISGPTAESLGATMRGTPSIATLALVAEYKPPYSLFRTVRVPR